MGGLVLVLWPSRCSEVFGVSTSSTKLNCLCVGFHGNESLFYVWRPAVYGCAYAAFGVVILGINSLTCYLMEVFLPHAATIGQKNNHVYHAATIGLKT